MRAENQPENQTRRSSRTTRNKTPRRYRSPPSSSTLAISSESLSDEIESAVDEVELKTVSSKRTLRLLNSDIEVKTSKVKVGRRPPLTSTPAPLLIQDDELDRLTVAELNVLLAERLHEYQTSYKQIVDKHSESYATAVRCTYDSYWAEKTADDYKETTKKEATSSETPNDDRGETNVAAHAKEHRTYVYRTGYCPYVAEDGDDDETNDSYDSSDSENSNKSNHIFNEYPEEKSRSDEEKDFNSDEHENDSEDEESSLMMKDMQCDMGYY